MSLKRLCDICGRGLNVDEMDFASVTNKSHSKDICNVCLDSAVRITFPGDVEVTGLNALTGEFTPATPAEAVPFQPNPATADNPLA